jgi:hypothetical protein
MERERNARVRRDPRSEDAVQLAGMQPDGEDVAQPGPPALDVAAVGAFVKQYDAGWAEYVDWVDQDGSG